MAAESQIDDAERHRLLTQYAEIAMLAGGLAHEIKNPLSTISMNLELLDEELGEGDSARDQRMRRKITTIRAECRHLEDILRAFLEFARAGELDLVEADLNELVEQFVDFYLPEARQVGIDISRHLESNLPPIRMDRSLMRQVLMNLALNAQQAMPDGGQLELQTFAEDDNVVLNFIDNGVGMTERARSRMFQVFYSTKPGGSGLGLSTVRKIVEAHLGSISCESEEGRGTRFSIVLPIAK